MTMHRRRIFTEKTVTKNAVFYPVYFKNEIWCKKHLFFTPNFQEGRVTLLTPSLLKASVSVPRYCSSFQLKELLICADKICTNHSAKDWTNLTTETKVILCFRGR